MSSKLRYVAALAAIGAGGAAQPALALTHIDYGDLTPGTNSHFDIYLAGSYEYTYFNNTQTQSFDCGPKCSGVDTHANDYIFNALQASFGDTTYTPGLPSPGEAFHDDFINTWTKTVHDVGGQISSSESGLMSDAYLHLKFDSFGTTYLGTAHFGGGFHPGLDFIDYAPLSEFSSGTPEPDAWALLIAGFGLAGAGLRRRRAQLAPQIAA